MPAKDYTAHKLILKLPAMVGVGQFRPSGLMIETICTYLQSQSNKQAMSGLECLKANGHSKQNWYDWQKKEGFMAWWNAAIAEYYSYLGLPDVYNAIYRRALGVSSTDAKLYLERFDRDYKPSSALELIPTGRRPANAVQGSRDKLMALHAGQDSPGRPKTDQGQGTQPKGHTKPVQSTEIDGLDPALDQLSMDNESAIAGHKDRPEGGTGGGV